jgi:RHS repeat-associated protein
VYAYDGDQHVSSILSYDSSSSIIENYSYTYDPAGNLATQTENGDYSYFNYDASGQLTLVGFLPSGSMTYVYSNYGYDAAGNRNTGGSTPTTGNQLTTDGTWDYTYDPKGNLIEKDSVSTSERWTYGYDNANELTQVKHYNTSGVLLKTIDYSYDVFGEEIQRDVTTGAGTTTTKFAVNGWNPALPAPIGNENFSTWAVLNAANTLQTRQIFGDQVDQALARIDQTGASNPSGLYFTLRDRQGSIRDVVDATGAVVDTLAYDGFGNIKAGELDPTYRGWYAYAGRQFDNEVKLQNNHARWYDATAGRWISQDPLGFDAGDSNLYRYVNNSPTNATDPSGHYLIAEGSNFLWNEIVPELKAIGVTSIQHRYGDSSSHYILAADPEEIKIAKLQHPTSWWVTSGYIDRLNNEGPNRLFWKTSDSSVGWRWFWSSSGEDRTYQNALRDARQIAQNTSRLPYSYVKQLADNMAIALW